MNKIITAIKLLIFNRQLFLIKILELLSLNLDTLEILKSTLFKKVLNVTKGKVFQGSYKGVDFSTSINFFVRGKSKRSYNSYYTQLLMGFYENNVIANTIALSQKYKLKFIVNFGSGDGAHLVSLVKNKIFKNGIGFEKDVTFQKLLNKSLMKNNVSNKVKVFGDIDINLIDKSYIDLKKTLFLVDVDGYEFSLFSDENISFFKDSCLIIEFHPRAESNKILIKKFFKTIKKHFKVHIFKDDHFYNNKIPYSKFFDTLNDDERYIMLSGSRGSLMSWIQLTPKN